MESVKRLLLAMALAITATVAGPASPASAGTQEIRVCIPVGAVGGHVVFDCFILVLPDLAPPKPPDPPT